MVNMSALLSSNQYKGVVSARGHLNMGQLGVNVMEKQERRNSRNWIPHRPFPKLAEPLSKLKGDDIRASATDWIKY